MMDVDYTLLFMLINFFVKGVVDNLIYTLLSNFFGQVPNFEIWRYFMKDYLKCSLSQEEKDLISVIIWVTAKDYKKRLYKRNQYQFL